MWTYSHNQCTPERLQSAIMKFLELPELEVLASSLSMSSPSVRMTTRLEAYSCKSVARERKLFKSLDTEFTSDLELSTSVSPPEHHLALVDSAFGPLDKKESRKTLWLLIATLNAAYPDHDFSRVKAEDFTREESARAVLVGLSEVLKPVREPWSSSFASTLGGLSISPELGSSPNGLSGMDPMLRQVLDSAIDLSDCEVYSYTPDPDSDPHAVDSEEEEFEDESVASSIFGDYEQNHMDNNAPMWEMDEIETAAAVVASGGVFVRPSAVTPSSRPNARCFNNVSIPGTPRGGLGGSAVGSNMSANGVGGGMLSPASRPQTPISSFSSLFEATAEHEESAGGLLWSTHYFLYNRRMKRVLFISAWARKPSGDHEIGGTTPIATSLALNNQQPVNNGHAINHPTLRLSAVSRDAHFQSLKRMHSGPPSPLLSRRPSNGSVHSLSGSGIIGQASGGSVRRGSGGPPMKKLRTRQASSSTAGAGGSGPAMQTVLG